jgi:hypothetical protein
MSVSLEHSIPNILGWCAYPVIVLDIETLCHHLVPMIKTAGILWEHPNLPWPNVFKSQMSTGTVVLSVLFDTARSLLLYFGSCNDTTNANHYSLTLHILHIKIKNKCLAKLMDNILLHDTAHLYVVWSSGPPECHVTCWIPLGLINL